MFGKMIRVSPFAEAGSEGRRSRNSIAQGEALGWNHLPVQALTGRDKTVATLLSRPFRAHGTVLPKTQGFTLGYRMSHLRRSIAACRAKLLIIACLFANAVAHAADPAWLEIKPGSGPGDRSVCRRFP